MSSSRGNSPAFSRTGAVPSDINFNSLNYNVRRVSSTASVQVLQPTSAPAVSTAARHAINLLIQLSGNDDRVIYDWIRQVRGGRSSVSLESVYMMSGTDSQMQSPASVTSHPALGMLSSIGASGAQLNAQSPNHPLEYERRGTSSPSICVTPLPISQLHDSQPSPATSNTNSDGTKDCLPNKRPWFCPRCPDGLPARRTGQKTARKADFKKHMKNQHEEVSEWVCPDCGSISKSADGFKQHHHAKHHEEDIANIGFCQWCPMDNVVRRDAMRRSAFGCGFCIESFTDWRKWFEHICRHQKHESKGKEDWDYDIMIQSLLRQSGISQAWQYILTLQGQPSRFHWDQGTTTELLKSLEYQNDKRDDAMIAKIAYKLGVTHVHSSAQPSQLGAPANRLWAASGTTSQGISNAYASPHCLNQPTEDVFFTDPFSAVPPFLPPKYESHEGTGPTKVDSKPLLDLTAYPEPGSVSEPPPYAAYPQPHGQHNTNLSFEALSYTPDDMDLAQSLSATDQSTERSFYHPHGHTFYNSTHTLPTTAQYPARASEQHLGIQHPPATPTQPSPNTSFYLTSPTTAPVYYSQMQTSSEDMDSDQRPRRSATTRMKQGLQGWKRKKSSPPE